MRRLNPRDDQLAPALEADPGRAAFVAQVRVKHGDYYGYEETRFVNTREEVRIRCPRHGVFEQNAGKHLRGYGCKACGDERRGAEQSRAAGAKFEAKARKVHGDKYGYQDVVYRDARTPVTIHCQKHGPFPQEPRVHLDGSGCKACGTEAMAAARAATAAAEYVAKAKKVHGNRYGYEAAVFVSARTNVTIQCSVHGPFEQRPHAHLAGRGCDKCGNEAAAAKRRKSTARFVAEASRVHGQLYDYSLVDYRSRSKPVTILCAAHGPFPQAPGHHLRGRGCPRCGAAKQANALRRGQDEFVEMARSVHGDRYGYEEADYRDSTTKVTIVCRAHAPFDQTPGGHLQGHGCPRCNHFVSKPETEWLDALGVPERSVPLETRLRVICVDGYDPATRTAYLFHGDFWHGNPEVFPADHLHPIKLRTYGELHRTTLMEEDLLREAGYEVVSVWEWDYRRKVAM